MLGDKRKDVTGEWRKFYNKELLEFYCSKISLD
jgi:hypothetical protein